MRERILILEDDAATSKVLEAAFTKCGFVIEVLQSGEHLMAKMEHFRPSAVVLDNTPGFSCLDSCQTLRGHQRFWRLPIVVYSGLTSDHDVISLLQYGADAVLNKALSPQVLVATVDSLFRRITRSFPQNRAPLQQGTFYFDPNHRKLSIGGAEIPVTPFEFEALYLLATNPQTVFSREEIMVYLRGELNFNSERMVDVLVLKLRKKHDAIRRSVLTARGQGYTFQILSDNPAQT